MHDTLQMYHDDPHVGGDGDGIFGDDKSYKKDMDNTPHTCWDDPFDLGAPEVGTPAVSFGEFMNLNILDIHSEGSF